MDLYDVKMRGFHSPLNAREIGQLFRTGQLGGQEPCKPRGEARWRTVDELFPSLKYEAAAGPLRFKKPTRSSKSIPVFAWGLIGFVFCGIIYFTWNPKGSIPADGHMPIELPGVDRLTSGGELRPSPHSTVADDRTASSNTEGTLVEKQQQEQTARERETVTN